MSCGLRQKSPWKSVFFFLAAVIRRDDLFDMNNQRKAILFALGAILLWSTVASAFKLTLGYVPSTVMLLIASWTSCVVLAIIVLMQKKMPELLRWQPSRFGRAAFLGLLNPLLYYLVLFRAYSLLPAQEAQPLNYTWPLVLVLLSTMFLRQRLSWTTLAGMLVSFCGVLIISTRGDLSSFRFANAEGVSLAVGSSVLWASYWLLNVRSSGDPIVGLFINFLFGSIYILLIYILFVEKVTIAWQGILGGIYIGTFEMGCTFVLWMSALRYARTAAAVSHLVYLSPFLSLIVIHMVLGETIFPSTIAGLLFIVSGIIINEIRQRHTATTDVRND